MTLAGEWMAMKVEVAKALRAGKVEKARDFLHKVNRDFDHSPYRAGELSGILFTLDVLGEQKR